MGKQINSYSSSFRVIVQLTEKKQQKALSFPIRLKKNLNGIVRRNPYKIDTDKPAVKKKNSLVHSWLADCEMKICPGNDSWYDHWVN